MPIQFADNYRVHIKGTVAGGGTVDVWFDEKHNTHGTNEHLATDIDVNLAPPNGNGKASVRIRRGYPTPQDVSVIGEQLGDKHFTDLDVCVYSMDGTAQTPVQGWDLPNAVIKTWRPPSVPDAAEVPEESVTIEAATSAPIAAADLSLGNRVEPD